VVSIAPRLSPRLVAAVERIDNGRIPIAEVCRRVGSVAETIGAARPSYEEIRRTVHEVRRVRAQPTTAQILLDIDLRRRPPQALIDHLSGVGVPKL
jgi:hypothetical protein